MKRNSLSPFTIAILALAGCAVLFLTSDASAQSDGPVSNPIVIGESFQIESEVMVSTREVNVFLPAGYRETDDEPNAESENDSAESEKDEKRFNVLYVIDGGTQQDFHHISGLAQLSTINGDYENLIVVGIKTENRMMELAHEPKDPRYIREPPAAGKSDQFLKYITNEVVPFVEQKYRTGERRAVIGESLAGLFIAEVFLKQPDAFTDYICISPSMWWDDRGLAKAAPELIAAHDDAPRKLYLTMADEGGTMQSGLDMMMEAIKANRPGGLDWQYVDRRETHTHSTIYHSSAYDGIKKLFDLPDVDYGETPWYLIEGGQPPENPSGG